MREPKQKVKESEASKAQSLLKPEGLQVCKWSLPFGANLHKILALGRELRVDNWEEYWDRSMDFVKNVDESMELKDGLEILHRESFRMKIMRNPDKKCFEQINLQIFGHLNKQSIELYHIGEELENLHSEMINCHSNWPVIRLFRFQNHSYGLVQPIKKLKIFKMAQKMIFQIVKKATQSQEKISEQIEMNSLAKSIKKQIKEKQNLQKKLFNQKNHRNLSGRSNFANKKSKKNGRNKLKGTKSKKRKFMSKSSLIKDLKQNRPDSKKVKLGSENLILKTPNPKSKARGRHRIKKSSLKGVIKHKKNQKMSIHQGTENNPEIENSKTSMDKSYFLESHFNLKVSKPKENYFEQNLNIKSNLEDDEEEYQFFASTSWKLDQKFNKRNSNGSQLRVLSGTSDFSKGISMNSNISKIRVLSGVSEQSEIANLNNLLEKKESKSNFVTEENSDKYQSHSKQNIQLNLKFEDEFEGSSKDILKIESKLQKKGFLEESDVESSLMNRKQDQRGFSRNSEMRDYSPSINSSHKKKQSKIVYSSCLKLKPHEIAELEDLFVPCFVKHIKQTENSDGASDEWKNNSQDSFGSEGSSLISSNEELRLLEDAEKMIQEMGKSRLNVKDLMAFAPCSAKKAIGSMLDSRICSNQSALEKGHLEGEIPSANCQEDVESQSQSQASKARKVLLIEPDQLDIKIDDRSGSNCSSQNSFPADRYDHEAILFEPKEGNDRVQGSPNLSDTFTSSRTQSFQEIERNYDNLMKNVEKTCLSQNFSIRTSLQNTVKLNKNSLDKASENQTGEDSLRIDKLISQNEKPNDRRGCSSHKNLSTQVNRKKFLESKLNQFILQQQSPVRRGSGSFAPLKNTYNIKSESNIGSSKNKNNLSLLNCSLSQNIYQKTKTSGFDLSNGSTFNDKVKKLSNLEYDLADKKKTSKVFTKNLSQSPSRMLSDIKNSSINHDSNQNSAFTNSKNDDKPHFLIGQSSRNIYNDCSSDRNFKLKPNSSFGDSNFIFENKGLYQMSLENINEASISPMNMLTKKSEDMKEVNIYNKDYETHKTNYKSQFRVRDVDELSAESEQPSQEEIYQENQKLNVSGHINQKAELQYSSRSKKGSLKDSPTDQMNNDTSINLRSNQEYFLTENPNNTDSRHKLEKLAGIKTVLSSNEKKMKFETPNGKIVTVNDTPDPKFKKYIPLSKKIKLRNSLKEKLKNKLNAKKKGLSYTPKETLNSNPLVSTPGNFANSVPIMPNMMMNPMNSPYYGNNFQNIPNARTPNPFNLGYYQQHYAPVAQVNPVAPIKNKNDGNFWIRHIIFKISTLYHNSHSPETHYYKLKNRKQDLIPVYRMTSKGTMINLKSRPSPNERIDPNIHFGHLKFFINEKDYGFLKIDSGQEIFVHRQQLMQAGVDVNSSKNLPMLRFSFQIAFYSGKRGPAKKAVNLKLLS